ncbi:ABC transporter substrate-binding protein [uncultured Propionibacterium sp.]|uniref:ABC transporter substrate-binding protein n=1 Tax=uncultured Propionibacterium sp. TaxID=218066 RepID=UPI00292E3825|nr:ABC transporter substrate-binding protein [uncultured Propionibacterium sp.]
MSAINRSRRRSAPGRVLALALCATTALFGAGCSSGRGDSQQSASSSTPASTDPMPMTGAQFPLSITDFSGQSVDFESAPQRVCVLAGTAMNIWYDVGGTAVCSVEITDNVKVVPENEAAMRAVPTVGATSNVDIEAVSSYDPDLVIVMGGAQDTVLSRLRELGIRGLEVRARSHDELDSIYRAFGALTGHSDTAQERIEQIDEQIDGVVDRLPDEQTSVVIVYVTAESLAVKLDDSIAGQIAGTLRLTNIASGLTPDDPGSETTPLDIEAVAAGRPDYVLVTSMVDDDADARARMDEEFASNRAWQAVDAVREGRIAYLPQEYFLLNGGPYYGDAVTYLAASVYPDVYGDAQQYA